MKISTIFFDLGNTLLYNMHLNDESIYAACLQMARKFVSFGYPVKADTLADRHFQILTEYYAYRANENVEYSAETVFQQTLDALGIRDVPEEHVLKTMAAFYHETQKNWLIVPGAKSLLDSLSRKKVHIGLITNASYAEDIRQLLQQHEIREYFDQIIISAEVGYRKPHKKIFSIALELMESRADQSVMIGDSLVADIWGASQSGIRSIWLKAYANVSSPLSQKIKPDAEADSISEIPAVLQALENNSIF